jgi:hypothetical protein
MLATFLAIQLAITGAGVANHTFTGAIKTYGAGFFGPMCLSRPKGSLTCGQCNALMQRSRIECPDSERGCTPGCPPP